MGYSLGAHLAALAAVTHPGRVASLVLGGVGARMISPPPSPGAMTLAEAMRTGDPQTIAEPTLRSFRLFADQQGEDRLALAACSEGAGANLGGEALRSLAMPVLGGRRIARRDRRRPSGSGRRHPRRQSREPASLRPLLAIPHALFKAAVFDFLEGWLE